MSLSNLVIILIVGLIVASVSMYLYRARKQGVKCIGCPNGSGSCSGGCSGQCGPCSGCPTENGTVK